ncbi:MAG: type III-B CRISPR module-associated protein Cmr5 [Bacteroidota bacterium]|nr:type III-B CRISPR module-associated protein Cmr5 [Bacteroidota bacterium]
MKDRIKKYIPLALQGIQLQLSPGNNEVNEKYDGYAASLGPAIITSGLLPAIAFYTDLHRSGEGDVRRFKIIKLITSILTNDGETILNPNSDNSLLEHLLLPANNTRLFRDKILDAVIALKLAFRNFKHV